MENATTGIQSPAFGYLSPPIDVNDASSDDGDHLQTPLTEHDNHHQPYAVFHQNQHHFSHTFFHSDVHPSSDVFNDDSSTHSPGRATHPYTSFSSILTPSPSEKPSQSHQHVGQYLPPVSPPHALDLANASLEFNPFSSSYPVSFQNAAAFSQSAEVFTPTKDTFDFLHDPFESPGQPHLEDASIQLSSLSALPVSTDCLNEPVASSSSVLLGSTEQQDLFAVGGQEQDGLYMDQGRMYSPRFPAEHTLNPYFVRTYQLGDELGAGGYGFVMTARHRVEGIEVAVKFIIKDKVPDHAWWDDEVLGRVPTEVMVMSLINHENIVKCIDLFEDDSYFYLVQELHGTPWISRKKKKAKQISAPGKLVVPPTSAASTPSLTPSPSTESNASLPSTPPQIVIDHVEPQIAASESHEDVAQTEPEAPSPESQTKPSSDIVAGKEVAEIQLQPEPPRPSFSRRPSYDLFECIEQSKHKRLSENIARHIFAQVVEAVYYLDSQGITHCDIKDENIVVDSEFKVKLIDFGSAVVADPYAPRPFYTLFFGTTAYAASEILRKQPYQAPPAEVWTLGVLLSYLLTGHSPFPAEQDAIAGRIVIREKSGSGKLSRSALSLMSRCLERDPERRADILEVRNHRWLQGALDRQPQE